MTVQVISSPVFAVSLPLVLHPAPGLNFGKHTFCIQQFDCFLVASRINFRRLSLASHPSDLSKLPLLTGTLVLLHLSIYCGPNRACAFVSLRLLFSVKYGIFQYGTLIVLLPPPGGESIPSALLWSSWGSMAVHRGLQLSVPPVLLLHPHKLMLGTGLLFFMWLCPVTEPCIF